LQKKFPIEVSFFMKSSYLEYEGKSIRFSVYHQHCPILIPAGNIFLLPEKAFYELRMSLPV